MKTLSALAIAASLAFSAPALAASHITWNSVASESRVAFGSIKANEIGEVHHFNKVKGVVKENGEMVVTIDLASIQTNIDIRDERITKLAFNEGKATAVLKGQINMDEVNSLKLGETKVIEIEANLAFAGTENDIDATMLIARLSENRVLVTTEDFIMVSTDDLGIDAAIDTLKNLASLDSITRVTPIAVRMVFEK